MLFRAYSGSHWTTWHRSFGRAYADAITAWTPMAARVCPHAALAVERSDGTVRALGENAYTRARAEYHAQLAHRDAVGVWG